MPKAHRHDDHRICDATTVVNNQTSVFVNQKLWAIRSSIDSHVNGQLHASPDESVTVEKIPVVVHRPEDAEPDDEDHENPKTAEGSDNVYAYGS